MLMRAKLGAGLIFLAGLVPVPDGHAAQYKQKGQNDTRYDARVFGYEL